MILSNRKLFGVKLLSALNHRPVLIWHSAYPCYSAKQDTTKQIYTEEK